MVLALTAGARRAGARRRCAAWAVGQVDQPPKTHDVASFRASVDSIAARLRGLDALRSEVSSGRFPSASTATGLDALRELERLASLPDVDATIAALAQVLNADSPEDPSAQAAAQAAAAALCFDAAEASRAVVESLEDAAPPEDVQLTGTEQRLADALRDYIRSMDGAATSSEAPGLRWPPPPPPTDPRPEAQAARLPAVAALAEAARDARAGTGASELQPPAPAPRAADLAGLLASAGETPLAVAGDTKVQVAGVMDVAELLRPGDAAVLALPPGPHREEGVQAALAEARAAGAAAAVLLGAAPEDAGRAEGWLAAAGLQALALLPTRDAAPRLARAFWGDPGAGLRCFLVLGDDPLEVRTAAWLLTSAAEYCLGAERTAALSSRRTLLGLDTADVGRRLTPCVVQELLTVASEGGAELCVLEALPGAQSSEAFDGLEFECAVDLGSSSSAGPGARQLRCRAQLLGQTRPGGAIAVGRAMGRAPEGWAAEGPSLAAHLELPPQGAAGALAPKKSADRGNEEVMPGLDLALAGVVDWERGLGLEAVTSYVTEKRARREELEELSRAQLLKDLAEAEGDAAAGAKMKKSELVELLLSLLAQEAEEAGGSGGRPASLPPGVLYGKVLSSTSTSRMELALSLTDSETVTLDLPLVGITGARAALAAARAALALRGDVSGTTPSETQWLRAALGSATAPPGTLEVLTGGSPPRVVAVLHEAVTAKEVRHALRAVREWLAMGAELAAPLPRLTAVLGCPGEMARGERAKCGWALAELCDRVVLTSEQPRAELPMQILEDILDAVRSRAPRGASCFSPPLPAADLHVVADRADAIKLAACMSTRPPATDAKEAGAPGVLVVFGSSHGDTQEAAGPDGTVRKWLCHDRRVLLEALELAETLSGLADDKENGPLDVSQVPWSLDGIQPRKKEALSFPVQSLHWTHRASLSNQGKAETPL